MKRIPFLDIWRGVVRPNVTYALVATVIWGFVYDKISGEMLFAVAQTVITFWFVDRQSQKALEKTKTDSE